MKTIKVKVYGIDELSDAAKEKARAWYRENGFNYEWWDSVYQDAVTCGKIMGVEIGKKDKGQPAIFFSGFSSQGDGASFEGTYGRAAGSRKAIRAHAPKDNTLHKIADALANVQKAAGRGQVRARIKAGGRECHEYSMDVEAFAENKAGEEIELPESVEAALTEAMRDFARWIYGQLRAEYVYLSSDEAVDETIRANEYEFLEDGRRACFTVL